MAVVAFAAGCKTTPPPPAWDTASAPERAVQAEVQFRRFGEELFEVLSVQTGTETTQVLEDDFHARSLLYRLPVEARVRFRKDATIEREEELFKHIGEPGWGPESHRERVMLLFALGPGPRQKGAEQDVHAEAVFEDIEPGWRFRAWDGKR